MNPITRATILLLISMVPSLADDKVQHPANVLMIIVDDMNDWVSALNGHPQVRTPHIYKLAQRGMLFTNAHVMAPVCNPSRVAALTGLNPSTTGIYDNSVHWHIALPDVETLPRHFRRNGYYVAGGGKVHHHTPGNNRHSDWDVYFDQVFDSHYQTRSHQIGSKDVKDFAWPEGFPLNQIPEVIHFSKPPANANEFDWGPWDASDDEMGDGQMVQWAVDILEDPPEKPFFLAAGIYRPHLPWYAPRKYFDMYPKGSIMPPPIKADDLDDVPEGGKKMAAARREDLALVQKYGRYQEILQAYLANISYADTLVGKLVDALDKGPAADNTIIVLWSDHGWHFGEKDHLHKFTLWERCTRIPMIISAPGVTEAGSVCSQPVNTVDLFPTLLDLCDLPPVKRLDGLSLHPQLLDHTARRERPALTTHKFNNHSLRSEHWRYIRYSDGGEELYDHRTDPNEWYNLAGDPSMQGIKSQLARWMPKTNAKPIKK